MNRVSERASGNALNRNLLTSKFSNVHKSKNNVLSGDEQGEDSDDEFL